MCPKGHDPQRQSDTNCQAWLIVSVSNIIAHHTHSTQSPCSYGASHLLMQRVKRSAERRGEKASLVPWTWMKCGSEPPGWSRGEHSKQREYQGQRPGGGRIVLAVFQTFKTSVTQLEPSEREWWQWLQKAGRLKKPRQCWLNQDVKEELFGPCAWLQGGSHAVGERLGHFDRGLWNTTDPRL